MRHLLTIFLVALTLAAFGQVGLQAGTSDSKMFLGVDNPQGNIGAHVGAIAVYTYKEDLLHLGVKFGVYIRQDHIIALNYKFFGKGMRGKMLSLSYEYNAYKNFFFGAEVSSDYAQLTIGYYLPTGGYGKGCY